LPWYNIKTLNYINQAEGKIIAIDNYLNIVLENDNGIETLKGGNIVYVSLNE